MVDIVAEAPEGFGTSIERVNKLTTDEVTELGEDVMSYLQKKLGAIKTDKWKQRFQAARQEVDEEITKSIINSVLYLYRKSKNIHARTTGYITMNQMLREDIRVKAALKHRLTVEQFTAQLNSSMVFSQSTTTALSNVWASQGTSLLATGTVEQLVGVGQLVDVQWKVGVAMSSEECKSLNSPFVTLSLTVASPSGELQTHTLELTMAQFRNFTNQLKEIATVLETV